MARSPTSSRAWSARTGAATTRSSWDAWSTRARTPARRCCSTAAGTSGSVPRAIVLGVVGDSGAGKTTVTRGLLRVLGEGHVTHISADDYHRFDRRRRRELGVTPLHPDSNHLDILTQHLAHLRRGEDRKSTRLNSSH